MTLENPQNSVTEQHLRGVEGEDVYVYQVDE